MHGGGFGGDAGGAGGQVIGEIAANDIGREARRFGLGRRFLDLGGQGFGQAHHFQGTGAMGAAAQKTAFFQGRNQAMNAGFGAQVERFLHFLKGRGKAGIPEMLINKHQQFMLFTREHLALPPAKPAANRSEQTGN